MANRTYYAWWEGEAYFLSFMPRPRDPKVMRPRQEFASREELEAEIARRNVSVKWENG